MKLYQNRPASPRGRAEVAARQNSSLKRLLQNSLCRPDLMILTSARFFATRHILLAIGELRKARVGVKRANLATNKDLQKPLKANWSIFLQIILFIFCFELSSLEPGLYRWEPDGWDNFGDAISQPLVERILKRKIKKAELTDPNKFLAVGSILQCASNGDIVWGSGILTGWFPQEIQRLDIRAVRGPLTRDILLSRGIPCPAIYGDPALLFGVLFPEFQKNSKREYIMIPHHTETHLFQSDPNFVSPTDPWEVVVQKIVESKFVISSSLHGIIIAEAYGIPAKMIMATNHAQFFKYQDYYLATGRPFFTYATSIQEALEMGGENPPICDLENLLNSFPYDLYQSYPQTLNFD